MNEEIKKMARDAGFYEGQEELFWVGEEGLERLVHIAQAAEREACAKVCGDLMLRENPYERWEGMKWCMDRIRARGEA